MPKPIAVFDIDGTIFRSSLFIEMTQALIEAGLFPADTKLDYEPEYQAWLNRRGGYETYLAKMVETFNNYLAGLAVAEFKKIAHRVIKDRSGHTYRYTRDLIKQLAPSHFLVAISGSHRELVEQFCKVYGFGDIVAAQLVAEHGLYTGQVIRGDLNKDKSLKHVVAKHNLTLAGSVGVGDSESDAAFLKLVERPIAFNPNSTLFTEAMSAGWQVVVERKDVIYYYNEHRLPEAN